MQDSSCLRSPGFAAAVIVGLLVQSSDTVRAQGAQTLVTERPGFSSSPVVLDPSGLQLETGYQFTNDSGVNAHTLPFALLRIGLVDRLELQLNWPGYTTVDGNGPSVDGISDLGVGVKWSLTDAYARVPIALFGGLSLPTGDDELTSDSVDPTVGLFWSYTGARSWFGTVTASNVDNQLTFANAVGLSLPVSVNTSSYVEYVLKDIEDLGTTHELNGGVSYVPQINLQYDAYVGVGINDRAPDFYLGVGASWRF